MLPPTKKKQKKNTLLDFPGSPVVNTLCFHHRRHGFIPVDVWGLPSPTKKKPLLVIIS